MPGRGRPRGTTERVRRLAIALDMLKLEGFKRNEAERLLAVFEEFPDTSLGLAVSSAIRKAGRPRSGRLEWRQEEPDVAEMFDEEDPKERAARQRMEKRLRDAEAKLRKRVEAVSKATANVRQAGGGAWPPYEPVELLGLPCRCGQYWNNNAEGLKDPLVDPDAQVRMDVPPHRHCCKCGIAARDGEPCMEPVIRLHPITLAPDFHGWACHCCLEDVHDELPPPPWEGLMNEVEIVSDEEMEELLR